MTRTIILARLDSVTLAAHAAGSRDPLLADLAILLSVVERLARAQQPGLLKSLKESALDLVSVLDRGGKTG